MNDSDEWFSITDLNEFVNNVRSIVYTKFGHWDDESENNDLLSNIDQSEIDDMDKTLSYQESLNIIKPLLKKEINKITKKIRYTLNEQIFADIVHDLNSRMISNILNSLVKKGLVESSYDSELNDFVFWIKEK